MSNSAIALAVNINTLVRDGWTIEMETGLRGGELRSWVTLKHWERNLKHKIRSAQGDLTFALQSAMMLAGVEYWDPASAGKSDEKRYEDHIEMERQAHESQEG